MGENDEKDKPNVYGFMDRFRNTVLGATMADQPAMMTASGWRQNEKGDYVQDQQNDSHVKQLRDNLAAEGLGVMGVHLILFIIKDILYLDGERNSFNIKLKI